MTARALIFFITPLLPLVCLSGRNYPDNLATFRVGEVEDPDLDLGKHVVTGLTVVPAGILNYPCGRGRQRPPAHRRSRYRVPQYSCCIWPGASRTPCFIMGIVYTNVKIRLDKCRDGMEKRNCRKTMKLELNACREP